MNKNEEIVKGLPIVKVKEIIKNCFISELNFISSDINDDITKVDTLWSMMINDGVELDELLARSDRDLRYILSSAMDLDNKIKNLLSKEEYKGSDKIAFQSLNSQVISKQSLKIVPDDE